jgi:hypothetical protein
MRTAALLCAALVMATGCATEDSADTTTTIDTTTTAAPAAMEAPAVSGPPEACTASVREGDTGPIGQAVESVPLPDDAVLLMAQVVTNTDVPGSFDVVVRVCSPKVDDDAIRALATELATAVAASGEPVESMRVPMWAPVGDTVDEYRQANLEDFPIYLWGDDLTEGGPPPESRWDLLDQ